MDAKEIELDTAQNKIDNQKHEIEINTVNKNKKEKDKRNTTTNFLHMLRKKIKSGELVPKMRDSSKRTAHRRYFQPCGILKFPPDNEQTSKNNLPIVIQRISGCSSGDDEDYTDIDSVPDSSDSEDQAPPGKQPRVFLGRVPLPAGANPNRGGGVAFMIRRTLPIIRVQHNIFIPKRTV